ncbi:MAG: adenylyltransferase/cytidyltransferase family protein [Burkholderiales bacterium]|jgi:rfaE bifunctional protein nucleotidyltransferase chain/domain|nr:adenylyltransferase/cytidyltransferase family protein [Burkholderiales bacterium]
MAWQTPPRFLQKVAPKDVLARVAALPRPLVFTNGVFDLLHCGHAHYLEAARCLGNALVVAVNSDDSVRRLNKGKHRPINTLDDRMALLAALSSVDLVISFDTDTPLPLILQISPDVLVKGGDYTAETTAGAAEVIARGGKFVAIPFLFERSTTALVKKLSSPE